MSASFYFFDWLLILGYFVLLVFLSIQRRKDADTESGYLLAGRSLTLPAFVATLVSTWYGGILGVGEFTYFFGIAQWFLFGFPFYVFAILFAIFLAGKVRDNKALTIPEAIGSVYGQKAGGVSAIWVFLLVSPAPYILMLGILLQFFLGSDLPILFYSTLIAFFSAAYVGYSGFKAVVRTDLLQIVLMYGGFIMLLGFAISEFGGVFQLWEQLPDSHRTPTGGHNLQYVLVWFFIALWTFVDPGFHQRAAAAESSKTARSGIFVSVGFWFIFDMLTLTVGLYGFVYLPALDNAPLVYPLLAETLLPVGLKGLFFLGLLATIMSTLDSFLFLSGQTLGRDLLSRHITGISPVRITQIAIAVSAILGVILTYFFPSVISLWYVIGSVLIPGLLIPVLGVYLPWFKLHPQLALTGLLLPVIVCLVWLILGIQSGSELFDYTYLGVEPFYPGLFVAGLTLLVSKIISGGK